MRLSAFQRAVAACPRIQNLNPRVQVDTLSDLSILNNESLLSQFNLVCLTDSDYATMVCAALLHSPVQGSC